MTKKERAGKITDILERTYPGAICSLEFTDAFQLMVATQLAAQCTDARVNIVTKDLFVKYPDVYAYAAAELAEFEQDIRSTGFYHNKARNIIGAARMLITDFGARVPDNMEDLLKLPGVGRKTANLVVTMGYDKPGICVDTHVHRISNR
ncbi:MAG: endonuclease III, partial [Clostridiales bacterium]|nr:endonuclease III [Clostridiales bacterium]